MDQAIFRIFGFLRSRDPTSKPYFRTLPNPRAWQDGTTSGKGKATDARGAMVAAVQAGKAGGRVTQVKGRPSPPR